MNRLSPTELERMQATQDVAMHDRCVIMYYTPMTADDGYGKPIPTWIDGEVVDCGYTPAQNPREVLGTADVSMSMPRFRLPVDTVLKHHDRIKLTHRFLAELVQPVYHEIIGTPLKGPSALVAYSRILTTGKPYGGD